MPPKAARRLEDDSIFTSREQLSPSQRCPVNDICVGLHIVFMGPTGCGKTKVALFAAQRFLMQLDGRSEESGGNEVDDVVADVSVLFLCASDMAVVHLYRDKLPKLPVKDRSRFIVKTYEQLQYARTAAELQDHRLGLVVLDDADAITKPCLEALNDVLLENAVDVPLMDRPLLFILGDPLPLLTNTDNMIDVLFSADTLIGAPTGELNGERPINPAEFSRPHELFDSWTLTPTVLRVFERQDHEFSVSEIRNHRGPLFALNQKRIEWWEKMWSGEDCKFMRRDSVRVELRECNDLSQTAEPLGFAANAVRVVADGIPTDSVKDIPRCSDVVIEASRWLGGNADVVTQINNIYRAARRAQQRVLITTEPLHPNASDAQITPTPSSAVRLSLLSQGEPGEAANSEPTDEDQEFWARFDGESATQLSPGIEKMVRYKEAALTDEQRNAFYSIIRHGRNVVLNAVAGSGKSTTALTISRRWLQDNRHSGDVLFLSFNKRLRHDMQAAVARMEPAVASQIHCRTLHSHARTVYRRVDKPPINDTLLTDPMDYGWPPRADAKLNFGLVVLDEAQDFTPLYINFVKKLLGDLHQKPLVIICGDPFQLLYGFMGATDVLLHRPEEFLSGLTKTPEFDYQKLSISFRISHEMAAFINEHLHPKNLFKHDPNWFALHRDKILHFWGEGICANPNRGKSPNSFENVESRGGAFAMTGQTIRQFSTSRTVLLGSTVRSGSPANVIAGVMTEYAWSIHTSEHDADPEVAQEDDFEDARMVATTVNQYKGREQDVVIFTGLSSFMQSICNGDPQALYNKYYVACTRARERLIVVQWDDEPYCTHLNYGGKPSFDTRKEPIPVSDFLRHMPHNPHKELYYEKTAMGIVNMVDGEREKDIAMGYFVRTGREEGFESAPFVIGHLVGVYLQLKIEGRKYRFPSELSPMKKIEREQEKERHEQSMPKIHACWMLQRFIDRLHQLVTKGSELDLSTVCELALAQAVLMSDSYHHWRQIDPTAPWAICKRQPIGNGEFTTALDQQVENSIDLLHIAFCCRTPEQKSARNSMSIVQKLGVLQDLAARGRIKFEYPLVHRMSGYNYFHVSVAPGIQGLMDIVLLPSRSSLEKAPKMATQQPPQQKKSAKDGFDDPTPPGETVIVELKVTRTMEPNHRLQVLMYGAMYAQAAMHYGSKTEILSVDGDDEFFPKLLPLEEPVCVDVDGDSETPPTAPQKKSELTPFAMTTFLMYPNHGELRHVVPLKHPHDLMVRMATLKMNLKWEDHDEAMKQLSEEPTISEEAAKIYRDSGRFPGAKAGMTLSEVHGPPGTTLPQPTQEKQKPAGFQPANQLHQNQSGGLTQEIDCRPLVTTGPA